MNAIPGKIHGQIASLFLLVHGVGHDERTWIPLFSIWMATWNVPNIKPIRWMALSLVVHLLPTLFWYIIHATNNTASLIAITSTPTASLVPSIGTWNTTVVFSAPFTATKILPLKNYTTARVTIENFWARSGRELGENFLRTFTNFDRGTVHFRHMGVLVSRICTIFYVESVLKNFASFAVITNVSNMSERIYLDQS